MSYSFISIISYNKIWTIKLQLTMASKIPTLDNNNKFNGLTYLDRYGISCTVVFGSETKISGYNGYNGLNPDKMNYFK